MNPIPTLPPFQARWEAPLKPSSCCTWQKVAQISFFALAALVRFFLLPATRIGAGEKQEAQRCFKGQLANLERHQTTCSRTIVTTPDGAKLETLLFRTLNPGPDSPTVIYFNPNAVLMSHFVYNQLIYEAIERGKACNVVCFNYRSVENSTGTFQTIQDLVVDGASVVQWVKATLGTPADRIHFYGRSLGGIIATQVKALNPEQTPGRLINERSGSSMDDFIEARTTYCKIFNIFKYILRWIGLSFDAAAAFRSLIGDKMIVYHQKDWIFPTPASLEHRVADVEHEVVELFSNEKIEDNPHNVPLYAYEDRATGQLALDRIHDFLFAEA